MDSLCRVRNIIMNVLVWRTVSVLTRVLFWYLFTSFLRNSGNKHQNNPLVSTETVHHSSTYITGSLYLFDSNMALSKHQAIIWTNVDTVYWRIYAGLHEFIIPPASTKLKGGYTGFTLSVCPSVDRMVSALYLQQYSLNPFHICTSYQATSEGVSRVMFVSKLKNFFDLESNMT